jgi:hypothetical protein
MMKLMNLNELPEWLLDLENEDIIFIKNFLLSSGSLKELAQIYGVTYPTVRLRLDRLMQKVKLREATENDEYIALIKKLAVNEKLEVEVAKILISEYKKIKTRNDN